MDINSPKQPHYPVLDGLRGVAILVVVIYHYFDFTHYFFFGWLGVDLFFVLSGFLITDILMRTLGQPRFLRNFYVRRVLRIFPIYYLSLIIVLLVLPLFQNSHLDLSYYQNNQFWFWAYLQNWIFTFRPLHGSKILLHFWSLAVEEQFYLLWPLTILLVRKPKILLAIVGSLLVLVGVTRFVLWNLHIENLAYSNLYMFTRIDGICVGCMLALLIRIDIMYLRRNAGWLLSALAIINLGFYFFIRKALPDTPFFACIGFTTVAVVFGFIVYEGVLGKARIINTIFNNRPLKFFGKISYGLYVYHWPAYLFLFPFFKKFYSTGISLTDFMANMVSAITVITISIIISVLSYRYFESNFLKLKNKFA